MSVGQLKIFYLKFKSLWNQIFTCKITIIYNQIILDLCYNWKLLVVETWNIPSPVV